MPASEIIMLLALAVNFAAMLVGGVSLLMVILKFHLRQEQRMTTVETEVRLIREHLGVPRAVPAASTNGSGGSCVAGARH